MTLSEQDRYYIEKYNFDAEETDLNAISQGNEYEKSKRLVRLTGFIEHHPGQRFSVQDVMDETGLSQRFCIEQLPTHPMVMENRNWHKRDKYLSIAPELKELTRAEERDRDDLGRDAVTDWYQLIEERGRNIKKQYRVIKRF